MKRSLDDDGIKIPVLCLINKRDLPIDVHLFTKVQLEEQIKAQFGPELAQENCPIKIECQAISCKEDNNLRAEFEKVCLSVFHQMPDQTKKIKKPFRLGSIFKKKKR